MHLAHGLRPVFPVAVLPWLPLPLPLERQQLLAAVPQPGNAAQTSLAVILLQSEACDECRGLPEEMSHVLQALRRNYAGEQAVWRY